MTSRGKQTTVELRKIIIKHHENGNSVRKIANIVNESRSTVQDIIKRYHNEGRISNKSRKGQGKTLNNQDERYIMREIKKQPFLSAPKLAALVKNSLNKSVSAETIRRVLRKNGRHGRATRRKPYFSEKNRKLRLKFAREHMGKDIDFWSKVLFSDESKFCMFGCDGRPYIWRKANAEFEKENIVPTLQHGSKSVMIWGCMSASGVGNLHFVNGIMDKFQYLNILKENVKQSCAQLGILDDFTFYADNDPKHTSLICKTWVIYNCPGVLHPPPQSPDLNVIEHLWEELARRLQNKAYSNLQQFKDTIKEEWYKIDADTTRKLVESMPRRLRLVEQNRGCATKY